MIVLKNAALKKGTAAFSFMQFDYPQFLSCHEAGGALSAKKIESQAMSTPLTWGLSLTQISFSLRTNLPGNLRFSYNT